MYDPKEEYNIIKLNKLVGVERPKTGGDLPFTYHNIRGGQKSDQPSPQEVADPTAALKVFYQNPDPPDGA